MKGHPGGDEHSRHMIALSGLAKRAKWLDMGAGAGETVRLLRSMGYDACGIDLHPGSEDVMQGDYLAAPYEDGSFEMSLYDARFKVCKNITREQKNVAYL